MLQATYRRPLCALITTAKLLGLLVSANCFADADLSGNRLLPWYLDDPPAGTAASTTRNRGWQLDLGAELGREPDYVGSNDYEFDAFPALQLHYIPNENWRFRLTPQTLVGVRDLGSKTLVQLVIEFEEGRESSETNDLSLLADGRDTVEAELTLVRRIGRSGFVYATWQPEVLDRDKGIVYFVGAGWEWRLADKLRVTPAMDVSWGDGEHMQTEFGVTAAEASILEVTPYRAGGGIKSTSAGINIQWEPIPRLSVLGSVELEYYFTEAADSPVIANFGSQTGFELELTLFYAF